MGHRYFLPMPVSDLRWRQLRPFIGYYLGDDQFYWQDCTFDDDGSVMIVVGGGDGSPQAGQWRPAVSISTDYGNSWAQRYPSSRAVTNWWQTSEYGMTAVNYDGSLIILSEYYGSTYDLFGRIWYSTDYGVSWTQWFPAGNYGCSWHGVSCSRDGQVIVAAHERRNGVSDKKMWITSDGGTNWYDRTPVVFSFVRQTICSSNGSSILVLLGNILQVYRTTDYGVSWTPLTIGGYTTGSWMCGAMSSDGTIAYVWNQTAKKMFRTTNSCSSWSEIPCPYTGATGPYYTLSCSGDGSIVFLPHQTYNTVYMSWDYGNNWYEQPGCAGKATGLGWRKCHSSYDGTSHIVVSNIKSRIWYYRDVRS